jgi:Polyketide cyclase / dehydrase and lipid transport
MKPERPKQPGSARRTRAVLAALLLALFANRVGAQTDDLDWIDWKSLDAGEVAVQTSKVDRGTVHIDLAIEIDADWQSVWGLLTACEISPEFVPNVLACRRLASVDDCNCELFEQTVKPAFFLPKFDHVFELEYFPPQRIEVRHVSGPIDRMDGSWTLMQSPDRPLVLIHSMTVKPGFPAPPLFVRNTLKRDLPKVLMEIRDRSERASAARLH